MSLVFATHCEVGKVMMNINDFKKEIGTQKTIYFMLLGFFTLGVYNIYWLYKRYEIFNTIGEKVVLTKSNIIGISILVLFSFILDFTFWNRPEFEKIPNPLAIFLWVVFFVIALRISKVMECYLEKTIQVHLKFNKFYLAFYNHYEDG